MDVKILHFYPDLMSLYGSYANVSLLRRTLERMGNSVSVERVEIGGDAAGAQGDAGPAESRARPAEGGERA